MAERQPGITKKMTFGGEEFEVPFAKGNPGKSREELDEIKRKLQEDPEAGDGEMVATMGFCAKYNPHTYMTEIPGVMCERDVACVLRDGTTIYADIYRPANTTEKVPVICVFAPFGKNPSEGMDSWQLMGVPPKTVSQYAKFEAPTPATGATTAGTPWPTWTRAASATPRATSTSGAPRTPRTAMTSSSG